MRKEKEKRRNKNGKLMFIHGSHQFMSSSNLEITPEVGSFYLFPSYLLHLVNPFFDTNEERRSISFNSLINNNIVNEN